MKKALFLLLTAALLAGCGKETAKTAAPNAGDPALVAPGPDLLAQLKLATVTTQSVAETLR
ncbi:MAG: efflux transporter periplasmic adaptor subunit, partial [Azonexus sp.]